MSIASYLSEDLGTSVEFDTFREAFRKKLRKVFTKRADFDQVSTQRGLPPFMMREIQSLTPLSVFIPEEYGGRGGHGGGGTGHDGGDLYANGAVGYAAGGPGAG